MFIWMAWLNFIALGLWISQVIFAFLWHTEQKTIAKVKINTIPKLSVVIPVYNESPDKIQKVIDSVLMQRQVNVELFVVDDGSACPVKVLPHSKLQTLRLKKNQGKRFAQIEAIKQATSDWIVTVDSDTILQPDALFELYKSVSLFKMDAVTGTLHLHNREENFLTRMISCLYWYGFFQERASQSYWANVTCCAGALSIYKKNVILENKEIYLNQKFLGQHCQAGDDRFLTCLFAIAGKRIGYSSSAAAYTVSPANLMDFSKQQLRWARSYTPALFFILRRFRSYDKLFLFFVLRVAFRYFYFFSLFLFLILSVTTYGVAMLQLVVTSILVVSLVKSTVAWFYTRDWNSFWLVPMSIISLIIFSPIIIYGVITPMSTGWLTRDR